MGAIDVGSLYPRQIHHAFIAWSTGDAVEKYNEYLREHGLANWRDELFLYQQVKT